MSRFTPWPTKATVTSSSPFTIWLGDDDAVTKAPMPDPVTRPPGKCFRCPG